MRRGPRGLLAAAAVAATGRDHHRHDRRHPMGGDQVVEHGGELVVAGPHRVVGEEQGGWCAGHVLAWNVNRDAASGGGSPQADVGIEFAVGRNQRESLNATFRHPRLWRLFRGGSIRWLDQKIAIAGAMSQGGEIGEPGDRRLFRQGHRRAPNDGGRPPAGQAVRAGRREVGACSSLEFEGETDW